MANNKEQKVKPYPYKVDYNDHFETPLVAYQDIMPLLRFLLQSDSDCLISTSTQKKAASVSDKKYKSKDAKEVAESSSSNKTNTIHSNTIQSLRMYDPYYCNGRTLRLLQGLGFQNVIHQKRDFYKDVANQTVPSHDVLVTNPPYSQNHKEQCLTFAMEQLLTKGRPFFVLIPNYVANKEYWRALLTQYENTVKNTKQHLQSHDDDSLSIQVVYLIPPEPYEYDHPEGTGHEIPPFASLWFCGFSYRRSNSSKSNTSTTNGRVVVTKLKAFWNRLHEKNERHVRLATSIQELVQLNAVPTMKRPNPKQRKKKRRLEQQQQQASSTTSETNAFSKQSTKNKKNKKASAKLPDTLSKKSRYRGTDGKRTRKRF
mmetsp:Transcript_7401/g.11218  ORF Transcript_7401/g.11218 Transcript_7401/m.11218 type:complete len:371 (-) Transcript_7401:620-1732(-)|eukprot:CAMPEP_0195299014 /NCGR_PEP_ID=MMETSP0707-20130614/24670_1 /TAXON_ID=33640 /ORGANISM="Asterionellopsis glacialis, Strain CCMP134" /LENGTH=370 /DNA_ID=CAMNT_0040361277 /DNA_START=67 /DNA_END=1179 /DNA_ORIENTATION=+